MHAGTLSPVGHEHQPAALVQPATGYLASVAPRVQHLQVFLAGLDQMCMRGKRFNAPAPQRHIRLRIQAYVRVQADQPLVTFALHQCQQRVGHGCHHQCV
ncbi:hypothetical protein D3C79_801230 [compost metagenome]